MDPHLKEQFVEALNNADEDKHCTLDLVKIIDGDCHYCALGILRHAVLKQRIIYDENDYAVITGAHFEGPNATYILPELHFKITLDEIHRIVTLNDEQNKTFKEIADYVHSHF